MSSGQNKRKFRLFSLEGLLGLVGIVCLVSGLVTGEIMPLFWGGMILVGLGVLAQVRKKDWPAHWEEQQRLRQLHERRKRGKGQDRDDS
jgi:hypothetical protein